MTFFPIFFFLPFYIFIRFFFIFFRIFYQENLPFLYIFFKDTKKIDTLLFLLQGHSTTRTFARTPRKNDPFVRPVVSTLSKQKGFFVFFLFFEKEKNFFPSFALLSSPPVPSWKGEGDSAFPTNLYSRVANRTGENKTVFPFLSLKNIIKYFGGKNATLCNPPIEETFNPRFVEKKLFLRITNR